VKVLKSLQHEWKKVGRDVLCIPNNELSAIKKNSTTDGEALHAVVLYWLSNCPHASWRFLIYMLDWNARDSTFFNTVGSSIRSYAEKLNGEYLEQHEVT